MGKEFIEAYREANPTDEIVYLDLYKENIPQFDADVLRGWGKLRSGSSFDQLSDAEKSKIARLDAIVDQYVAADKYVYVSPMWNFSIPLVLKAYTDAASVAGKTFKYTKNGPVGLLSGKKAYTFKLVVPFIRKVLLLQLKWDTAILLRFYSSMGFNILRQFLLKERHH